MNNNDRDMNMSYFYQCCGSVAVVLGCMSLSQQSFAQDDELTWIVGANMGHKSQELKQLLDSKLSFYMGGVSARVGYSDFYAAVNLASSLSDADVSEEGEIGDASRTDMDVTIGWNINPSLTVFGGYKTGETEIDFRVRDSVLEDVNDPNVQSSFTDSFEESGLFFGVAYGVSLQDAGQLSFSIAYADMDADNKLVATVDETEDDGDVDFDDLSGTYSGDVDGYSAAAVWSIPVGERMVYQALVRYNRYEQSIDDTVQGQRFKFDVDERFVEFGMGLYYAF